MRYTCQVIFVASFVIFFAGVLDGVHVTGLTLPWVASAPYGACRRGRRPRTNWRSRSKRQFTASGRPPTARRSTPSTTPKVELPQVPLRRRDLRPPPGCGKGARARLGALATEIARKRASCPYALRLVVRCACEAMFYGMQLARISHRFLLNKCNCLDNKELWDLARNSAFLRWCSAETSKRQAREAVLSLRPAWSRARARSRRGSRSALPHIASRICETSGRVARNGTVRRL